MYYVTQSHGHAFPVEVERLWSTLASNKRNIIPILDFLISLGMRSALQVSVCLRNQQRWLCEILNAYLVRPKALPSLATANTRVIEDSPDA